MTTVKHVAPPVSHHLAVAAFCHHATSEDPGIVFVELFEFHAWIDWVSCIFWNCDCGDCWNRTLRECCIFEKFYDLFGMRRRFESVSVQIAWRELAPGREAEEMF